MYIYTLQRSKSTAVNTHIGNTLLPWNFFFIGLRKLLKPGLLITLLDNDFLLFFECSPVRGELTPEKPWARRQLLEVENSTWPRKPQWIKHFTRKSSLSKFSPWHRKQQAYLLWLSWVTWVASCKAHSSVLALTFLCLPSPSAGDLCKAISSIL